jgi:hypothetical protein
MIPFFERVPDTRHPLHDLDLALIGPSLLGRSVGKQPGMQVSNLVAPAVFCRIPGRECQEQTAAGAVVKQKGPPLPLRSPTLRAGGAVERALMERFKLSGVFGSIKDKPHLRLKRGPTHRASK